MIYELGERIFTKPVGLRAKSYSDLLDEVGEDKKAKGTRKCLIKRELKFENYRSRSEVNTS